MSILTDMTCELCFLISNWSQSNYARYFILGYISWCSIRVQLEKTELEKESHLSSHRDKVPPTFDKSALLDLLAITFN